MTMTRIYSYSNNGSSISSSGWLDAYSYAFTSHGGSAAAAAVWDLLSSSVQTVLFGMSAALAYSLLQQQNQQQHHQQPRYPRAWSRSLSKGNQQRTRVRLAPTTTSTTLSKKTKTLPSRMVHAVLHCARQSYHMLFWSLPLPLSSHQQQQQPQHPSETDTDPPPLWFWLGLSWWGRMVLQSLLQSSLDPTNRHHHDNNSSNTNNSMVVQATIQNTGLAATLLVTGYYYMYMYDSYVSEHDQDDDNENDNNDFGNTIFRNNFNNTKRREKGRSSLDHPPHSILNRDFPQHGDETAQRSNTAAAAAAAAAANSNSTSTGNRHGYLELLVHNVSHTDLILSLDTGKTAATTAGGASTSASTSASASEQDPYCFGRPRFSCFDLYSRRVLAALQQASAVDGDNDIHTQIPTMDFYRYQRSYESDTGTEVQSHSHSLQTNKDDGCCSNDNSSNDNSSNMDSDATIPRYTILQPHAGAIPVGLVLPDHNDKAAVIGLAELNDLRIRGRDQAKLAQRVYREHDSETDAVASTPQSSQSQSQESASAIAIRHVFFPLLASLLPRWNQQIADKRYNPKSPVKRVLILVSGVGTPRNWTHAMAGNSTQACADLMELFLHIIDPDLTVVKIHSDSNIFRYDENLLFMERQLLPTVNAYRDAHAYQWPYPDDEQQIRPLVVPPQSTQASSFNIDWQKSFALTLSFADGSPARTYAIQASLRPYRPTYFHFWQLKTFWHESKIVDDDLEVHSFEEMETSPAVDATRCTDPMIQSVVQEIKAFSAEMTLTLQNGSHDLSKFWLRKTHKPVLAVLLVQSAGAKEPTLYRGTNMEVSMPTGSLCAERNVIGTALADNPALKREDLKLIAVLAVPQVEEITTSIKRSDSNISMAESVSEHSRKPGSSESSENHPPTRKTSLGSDQEVDWVLPPQVETDTTSFTIVETALDKQQCVECGESRASGSVNKQEEATESTPVRRIKLFSKSTNARKSKRTVIVQSTKDLNPLRPCGACNEWLKKIAEPNPYFRILTFTDADCNGVYITPCQE